MEDSRLERLRYLATAFRGAIEATRAERVPGALPYFPEGACRMTSRLLAQYLAQLPGGADFGRQQVVSGVLPGSEPAARHYWLQVNETVVDLTADAFGEARVVVGSPTQFHLSLTSQIAEDVSDLLASVNTDERARLARQLAVIESRMSNVAAPQPDTRCSSRAI